MTTEDIQKEKNGKWQDFVNHCIDLFDDIDKSEYRKTKIDTIKEAYRIYEQQETKTNYPWPGASIVVLPMTTITVDNQEPRLYTGLVGKKPIVQLQIEGLTEQDEQTKILEDWYNDELVRVVKIEDNAGIIVHKALLEGTVYPLCSYNEDEIVRRDFVFDIRETIDVPGGVIQNPDYGKIVIDEESGKPLTEDFTDSIFQGGKIEYAAFNDVYVADDADDWESADVIRKVRYTYAELQRKKGEKGWMNIGSWILEGELSEELSEDDQSPSQSIVDVEKIGKKTIECLECYIEYIFKSEEDDEEDITDWTSERYLAVISKEKKILIRMLPLREINFKNEKVLKRIRLYREYGRAYGESIYEKMKSIQNGSSDLFNMVVNVATITMIPWFLFSDAAGIDGEAILTPGKGVKCDDPSKVVFPRFAQNPRSYIVFIEMFMSLWEKLGSIGDIQIGRLSESRKDATATETMAAIQEGNIKHNYQSISLKDEFMSVIKTIYDLYYQKMPYNKTHLYHGQPVQISRMNMRRPYKFKLVGSTDLSNKVLEMQKTQQMYTALIQNPTTDPVKLTTDLVESIKPEADPQIYINPELRQLLQVLAQNPMLKQALPQMIQEFLNVQQTQLANQENAQELNKAQVTGETIAKSIVDAVGGASAQ